MICGSFIVPPAFKTSETGKYIILSPKGGNGCGIQAAERQQPV